MKILLVSLFALTLASCAPSFPPETHETELIVRKMRYYPITENFNQEEYNNTPAKYYVLKIYYRKISNEPRLYVLVERYRNEFQFQFEVYKSFETKEDVLKFAKANGIEDIILDESRSTILRPIKGQRESY